MRPNRIFSLLGLAKKAGQVVSGEFQTEKAVKSGAAQIVILSKEASENTSKKFKNMCSFYEVPVYSYGTREELGGCIGCEYRACLAILDPGFCRSLEKLLQENLLSAPGNIAE